MSYTFPSLSRLGALGFFVATAAFAVEAPPAPAPAKDFHLPAVTRYTLANGLKVTLVPYGTVPKVALGLVVRGSKVDEGAHERGLADLTGDYLQEGTTSHSAKALAETTSSYGGELSIGATADEAALELEVLEEFAAPAVALLGEVARTPAFPASELNRLKEKLIRDTTLARGQPQMVAQDSFARATYGAHPYGQTFPDVKEVSAFTLDQVKGFYQRTVGPNRAHLYVVGRYDEAAVRAAVQKAFEDWKPVAPEARPTAHPTVARGVLLVDRPGAVQSTVVLGRPVISPSSPDYIPEVVTNALLGGSFTSRITTNLREKHGYTYSPGSRVSLHPKIGIWAESADVTTASTAPAIQEVFNEIRELRAHPPTAEELASFQRYLSGTFILTNNTRHGIMGQLRMVDLHGLPEEWLSAFVGRVNAVTPAQVQQMAQRYLDPKKMTLVVVGDRKVIEPSLKPFGKLTVQQAPTPAAAPKIKGT